MDLDAGQGAVSFGAEGGSFVLLPHGLYDEDGVCHREARLRPITGSQELMLAGEASAGPRATSALLAACLARVGGYEEVEPALAAALTRGDRHHLALHLRAAMFGDRISLVVPCPNPACKALADMDLSVASIAPAPTRPAPEILTIDTPDGVARVREPTGEDDELIAVTHADRRSRSALLWSRLLVDLGGAGAVTPERWAALSAATRHAVALGLAQGTAAPDVAFLASCPSCAAVLELELDPVGLLVKELTIGADRLFAEIHCLAWYYHWSEAEVLALPRPRRWRYLDLLRRQVEGSPLVDAWSRR